MFRFYPELIAEIAGKADPCHQSRNKADVHLAERVLGAVPAAVALPEDVPIADRTYDSAPFDGGWRPPGSG